MSRDRRIAALQDFTSKGFLDEGGFRFRHDPSTEGEEDSPDFYPDQFKAAVRLFRSEVLGHRVIRRPAGRVG